MADGRDDLVYRAKLAEQAERYDEMAEYMQKVVNSNDQGLSVEERNLLSVAFKNKVGSRRASWRIVSSVEQKERSKENKTQEGYAEAYRKTIEKELDEICEAIISLLENTLSKNAADAESKVFYHKMKGDYFRYEAEYRDGESKVAASKKATEAYNQAMDVAKADLTVTHPIRLGLALNFSVFHYEVLQQPEDACAMARAAFEEAIAELDNVSEDSYKDSTLIMQLLRDNLTLWTSDENEN